MQPNALKAWWSSNTDECRTINFVAALRTGWNMREYIYGWRAASCQHVKDVVQCQFRSRSALATARDTTQRLVQRSFINENDTRALHGWKITNRYVQTDIREMGDWEVVIRETQCGTEILQRELHYCQLPQTLVRRQSITKGRSST